MASYSNALGANRVRLRLPPQAAPAKGRLKAQPLHSPEGTHLRMVRFGLEDCHKASTPMTLSL